MQNKKALCNMFSVLKDSLSVNADEILIMDRQRENYRELFCSEAGEDELVLARCMISATRTALEENENSSSKSYAESALFDFEKVFSEDKISKKEIKSVISKAITALYKTEDRVSDSMICVCLSAADVCLNA